MRWSELVVIAVAAVLAGCSEEIESEPESRPLEATRLTLASTAAAAGAETGYATYLYSERDVDVVSRLGSGVYFEQGVTVQSIYVEVGDRVSAGELLAILDDAEVLIQVEAVQAAADEAQANFARVEKLKEKEVAAASEYDTALYAKRFAEAELKRAKLDLSRTRVRAPFAGVVARRYIRVAELIEGSTPLFRITAMTPLRARLRVPEINAPAFRAGAPARIIGSNGESATARVIVVGPTVDPGSGTREVLIELTQPDGFRPGAAVLVEPAPEAGVEGK
jgi:RND family efflux transporter MFP subunit